MKGKRQENMKHLPYKVDVKKYIKADFPTLIRIRSHRPGEMGNWEKMLSR